MKIAYIVLFAKIMSVPMDLWTLVVTKLGPFQNKFPLTSRGIPNIVPNQQK